MKTFKDLGIPFPLFQGPVNDASEYIGQAYCCKCGEVKPHCFELGIGCSLIVKCKGCNSENELDADDREDCKCLKCKENIIFPLDDDQDINICYDCLRAGHAAITKDTEYGMISWRETHDGVTHGVPGLKTYEFELVPKDDDWVGAKIGKESMLELLRTPTFTTIQGECWLFCCKKPMVYLGSWSREEFTKRAPDGDGKRYFERIVPDAIEGLWEDELHDITGVYVFCCRKCNKTTANWDIA